MRAARILIRRTAQLLLLLLFLTGATFALSSMIPGDFYSRHELDPSVRAATLEELRRAEGLDLPAHLQYWRWLRRFIRLDLGRSLFYGAPVASVVADAARNTLWLSVPALVAGFALGVVLGTAHAAREGRPASHAFDIISAAALSLPTLLLGLLALLFAARTHLFPLGGVNSVEVAPGMWAWLADRIHHLALPAACLTLPVIATVERIQQAAAKDLSARPFVRSARARGLGSIRIFIHYRLRPALNPVVSTSGPILAGLLSGSLVLEVLFSWPGLGKVTYDALFNRDLSLLVGCVVAASVLLVAGNLIADLLLAALDPRTRSAGGLR